MVREKLECVSRIIYPPVCLLSRLSGALLEMDGVIDIKLDKAWNMSRTVDLDIDIGADAVDYKYVYYLFAMIAY